MENSKLGIRKWIAFIVAGLVGQLAWAIENNYLNLYVFGCTDNYNFIPIMTALSAVVATITTLFIGALSDRLGKRKIFICAGYILWGISILLFAFLNPTSSFNIVANSAFIAGTLIVIMDCVMTFFGSTANDAAFNAYVTDNTNPSNRGKVEAVLSILPLFAVVVAVVLGSMLYTQGKWDLFFYIFGGLVTVIGVVCLFLFGKENLKPNKEEPYLQNIIHGFRPTVVKANPKLYLALLTFMVFNIAIQVFMPYLMVYIDHGLDVDYMSTVAPIIGAASIITVVIGVFMDKIGKNKVIFPALGAAMVGGILMTFLKSQVGVIIACTLLMAGYLVSTAVLGAKVRDYTPANQAGLFQGVRMVFVVMIPMVTGPYIGVAATKIRPGLEYTNDYGQLVATPSSLVFLFTAVVLLFVLIPLFFLFKKEKQEVETVESASESPVSEE